MPKVVITHAVADIERWLEGKTERAAAIESGSGSNVTDFVAHDGSNNVAITADVEDLGALQTMLASPPPDVLARWRRTASSRRSRPTSQPTSSRAVRAQSASSRIRLRIAAQAGAGNRCLNVNASGVGPCSARTPRRRKASSTVGIVPAGCHHSATLGPSQRWNHSNRRANTRR